MKQELIIPGEKPVDASPLLNQWLQELLKIPIPMTPQGLSKLEAEFSGRVQNLYRDQEGIIQLFEGLKLRGAKFYLQSDNAKTGCIEARWVGEFIDGPRYRDHIGGIPLGTFEDMDLYYAPQPGLGPTLVARYGVGENYTTWNPAILGLFKENMPEWARVAVDRSLYLGLDVHRSSYA